MSDTKRQKADRYAELPRLWRVGLPVSDLARMFKVSRETIYRHAQRLGLPPQRGQDAAEVIRGSLVQVFADAAGVDIPWLIKKVGLFRVLRVAAMTAQQKSATAFPDNETL